jgi:hypothetical protein
MQIEQTRPGPSCYRDVVPEGQTGFHHVCKITDDYARDGAALKARGILIANEFISSGDIPACYADTREEIGWDGADPIRVGADHIAPSLQPA